MQKSVQAERRLISVFLYGLPLLLDLYTAEKLVVVRGSIKVCKVLQDVRYKEYCSLVRNAHKKALERIELARLPLEERMAAQLEQLAMQQAEAHSHAVKAMLVSLKVTQNPTTSAAIDVDEPELRAQQASFASLPEAPVVAAKCGLLHFADLHAVEQAFHEWPKIESQMAAQGGCGPLTKQSKNNYNKRRHLVQRIRLLMDVKPHGLSAEAACRVYQHVKQQGDFSIAELRNAVNHAEPVPDSRARGGLAASRKDMDVMPRVKKKPQITRRQILAWREEALQAELDLSSVVLGFPDDA